MSVSVADADDVSSDVRTTPNRPLTCQDTRRRSDRSGRLPGHDGAVRSGHAEHAAPAGAAGGLGHLVVRVVREQRVTGVGAAGGEPPRARDEEPDVARADDRHEERRDLLVVGDPVEPASVEVDVRTGGVDHGKVLCISAVGALSQ